MRAGRIVLLIFGIFFVLVSFGLLGGGGAILAAENSFKDDQGFYITNLIPVESAGVAVITGPAEINLGNTWVPNHNLATVKITAINRNSTQPVFIGVADTVKVDQYLHNVSYSEARGFNTSPQDIYYHNYTGASSVAAPTTQNFWDASINGTGSQTLTWDVVSGNYTFVLMNADGSSPVDARVSLGIKLPQIVHSIGIGLLVGGIVVILVGAAMIFFAARGFGQQPKQTH
jgi:hypothetical protein